MKVLMFISSLVFLLGCNQTFKREESKVQDIDSYKYVTDSIHFYSDLGIDTTYNLALVYDSTRYEFNDISIVFDLDDVQMKDRILYYYLITFLLKGEEDHEIIFRNYIADDISIYDGITASWKRIYKAYTQEPDIDIYVNIGTAVPEDIPIEDPVLILRYQIDSVSVELYTDRSTYDKKVDYRDDEWYFIR